MKTYSVSKVKQLIDLNGDSVNFEIKFKVSSHNQEPFDILVVDQTTLDNTSELKYKNITNGSVGGQLRNDKNNYQNHFLIIKADSPCECDVEIEKVELPVNSAPVVGHSGPTGPTGPTGQLNQSRKLVQDKDDSFHWVKIVLGLGLMVGGGFALYWFSQKYDKVILYTPPRILSPVKIQTLVSGPTTHNGKGKNSLLDRLNSLEIDE
jgi:hypothetical protein